MKKALETLSKKQRSDRFTDQVHYLSNFLTEDHLNIKHPNTIIEPENDETVLKNMNIKKATSSTTKKASLGTSPTTSPAKLVPSQTTYSYSQTLNIKQVIWIIKIKNKIIVI